MPVARPQPSQTRVIAHVDLDCFYVQVEQRKRPELRGKPTAVVQYNSWKGGGLIAVGYEARHFGVTRSMRGDDAKKVCPEIELIQVPVAHGKADLTQYRDAGSEVVSILSRKGICERASIDEVYLDITEEASMLLPKEPFSEEVLKSHILGYEEDSEVRRDVVLKWLSRVEGEPDDHLLACGAVVIAELRLAVLTETGFTCSAGIAHNKMLAKLASGMHKPAQQTIVPSAAVTELLASLPIKKMKQLGGKLGDSLQSDLQVSFVGDLLQFSKSRLQELYGLNSGTWLWNIARGMSGDEVKARTLPKSHSCGKTFPGPKALKTLEDVQQWIRELAGELQERLDVDYQQNHRVAHLLSLHAEGLKGNLDRKFPSRSCVLRYGKEKLAEDALKLFERALNEYLASYSTFTQEKGSSTSGGWAITALFIGASNISAIPSGINPITRFFPTPVPPSSTLCSSAYSCANPAREHETMREDCEHPNYPGIDESANFSNNPAQAAEGTLTRATPQLHNALGHAEGTCVFQEELCIDESANCSKCPSQAVEVELGTLTGATTQFGEGPSTFQEAQSMEQISNERLDMTANILSDACDTIGIKRTPTSADDEISKVQHQELQLLTPSSIRISVKKNVIPANDKTQLPAFTTHSLSSEGSCTVERQHTGVPNKDDGGGQESHRIRNKYEADEHKLSEVDRLSGNARQQTCHHPTCSHRVSDEMDISVSNTKTGSSLMPCSIRDVSIPGILRDVHDVQCSNTPQFHDAAHFGESGTSFVQPTNKFQLQQRTGAMGIPKLRDLWNSMKPNSSSNEMSWSYKKGDIDAQVLSELPEELQHELCISLGLKRPRLGKKSTINDFFEGTTRGHN